MKALLERITDQLIELRTQSESVAMQQARLFAQVKNEKLYDGIYSSFSGYCEHIGYTRQHVYSLIRIYEQETVRQAHNDIGTMAANAIVSAIATLPELEQEQAASELITFARSHSAGETVAKAQSVKAQASQEQGETEQSEPTLESVLTHKSKLLQRKADLLAEISAIETELAELEQAILELAA